MGLGFAVAAGHAGELECAGGSLKQLCDTIHYRGLGGLGWDQVQWFWLWGFGCDESTDAVNGGDVIGIAGSRHRGWDLLAEGAVWAGSWGDGKDGIAMAGGAGGTVDLAVQAGVTAFVGNHAGAITPRALPFSQELASQVEAMESGGGEGLGHLGKR